MAVIGLVELALATTCTGDVTVAPLAGELMVTPDAPGVGVGVAGGAELTVIATVDLKIVFFESQACTTMVCLPAAMLTSVSILLAAMLYTLTLST